MNPSGSEGQTPSIPKPQARKVQSESPRFWEDRMARSRREKKKGDVLRARYRRRRRREPPGARLCQDLAHLPRVVATFDVHVLVAFCQKLAVFYESIYPTTPTQFRGCGTDGRRSDLFRPPMKREGSQGQKGNFRTP